MQKQINVKGEYVSIGQIASILKVSRCAVIEAVKSGQLNGLQIGSQWRVDLSSPFLDGYERKKRVRGKPFGQMENTAKEENELVEVKS